MCNVRSVAQSCPALCDPMDCSPPGSSVHEIFQARILEWVAVSFSRGSSPPRDGAWVFCVSCIGRWILLPLSQLGSIRKHAQEILSIWYVPRGHDSDHGCNWTQGECYCSFNMRRRLDISQHLKPKWISLIMVDHFWKTLGSQLSFPSDLYDGG